MVTRLATDSDWKVLQTWPGIAPRSYYPSDSTLVTVVDDVPMCVVGIFFTSSQEVSYAEGFCVTPIPSGIPDSDFDLDTALKYLADAIDNLAYDRGVKRVLAIAKDPIFARWLRGFGFNTILSNLVLTSREVSCL